MHFARVLGPLVATAKIRPLEGYRLAWIEPTDSHGKPTGEPYIAVDTVSAGTGDLVMVTDGSSARYTSQTNNAPVDAVIVGVIDSLEMGGKVSYRKE